MNVKKTIKKVVALGAGAVLVGATILGAVATDLADYPEPFVKDGVYDAKIVVGADAATQDVVGAIDIAASLQAAAKEEIPMDGETTYSVADGYKFESSDTLILNGNVGSIDDVVDYRDMPSLINEDLMIEDDDYESKDYDYDIELQFETGNGAVSVDSNEHDLDEITQEPVIYYNLDDDTDLIYSIVVDFEKSVQIGGTSTAGEGLVDSETINLFGIDYTFDPNNQEDDDSITLFGADSTTLVNMGETVTMTYDGEDYEVKVLGGNSDDATAILSVNGETKTVESGDSTTMNGLPIYVDDVFVSNIGGDDVSVNLFVGSNKLVLENGEKLEVNGVELDEVEVEITEATETAKWDDVGTIKFKVSPAQADEEVKYILSGEDYVDPAFGAFKLHFVGEEDLTANKGLIDFERSGKALDLTFAPRGGEEITITPYDTGNFEDDFVNSDDLSALKEDYIFILNEDADKPADAVTHVLKVEDIKHGDNVTNTDFNIEIKDLTFGDTYILSDGDDEISNELPYHAADSGDAATLKLVTSSDASVTYEPIIYTDEGAKIVFKAYNATWDGENGSEELAWIGNVTTTDFDETDFIFEVTEDVDDDYDTLTNSNIVTIQIEGSYDATDNEYGLSVGNSDGTDYVVAEADDDNNDYALTRFGTYVIEETDDSGKYVELYVPDKEVSYDMFVMPLTSSVTTTSSGSSYDQVNAIGAGMALLDTEINAGDDNLVVVGGPCANSVAYDLMEPETACGEDFEQGKGLIKLFETTGDTMAILVAGYDAADTLAATEVLVDYEDHADVFEGKTEVEITTSSKEVTEVSEPEEDAEDDADEDTGDNETTE